MPIERNAETVNPDSTLHARSRCATSFAPRCYDSAINAAAPRPNRPLPFLFSSDLCQNARHATAISIDSFLSRLYLLRHRLRRLAYFITLAINDARCQIDRPWPRALSLILGNRLFADLLAIAN